jgi:chromosome segregation ATPase
MIKNLKEIIIFSVIIIVLVLAAWCFLLKRAAVVERLFHEDMLFQENVLKEKAQQRLSRLQGEIDGLQKSIDNLTAKSDLLESELLSVRQELESAKRNLTRLKNQNVSAMRKTAQADADIANLKNKIAHLVKESLDADDRLTLLLETRNALSLQVEQYRERMPKRSPIITQEERPYYEEDTGIVTETVLDEPLFASGEVLTVNREFAFLVISLGKTNGIEEGMLLNIRRDNTNLAQARVETVREHISAAALIDKENLTHIRSGDNVFITGSA